MLGTQGLGFGIRKMCFIWETRLIHMCIILAHGRARLRNTRNHFCIWYAQDWADGIHRLARDSGTSKIIFRSTSAGWGVHTHASTFHASGPFPRGAAHGFGSKASAAVAHRLCATSHSFYHYMVKTNLLFKCFCVCFKQVMFYDDWRTSAINNQSISKIKAGFSKGVPTGKSER